jgi:hypothetical protein
VGETSFGTPGDRALKITRTFDAPRRAVFDAFTLCDSASQWMGPPAWEVTGCEIDPRPGGVYRFVWEPAGVRGREPRDVRRGLGARAAGHDPGRGCGRDPPPDRPHRDGQRDHDDPHGRVPVSEMRDAAAQLPMKEAMDAGYDKLAEFLRTIA